MRIWMLVLTVAACGSDPNEMPGNNHLGNPDAPSFQMPDAAMTADASTTTDASTSNRDASTDASSTNRDASGADASSSGADASSTGADAGSSGADASTRPACLNGRGWAAFRFHYSPNNGTNAIVDAFGLSDASNWEATPVYSTSVVDSGNGGGLEIASGNWILIRYSVVGLTQISGATFSVYGRSYDTTTSGSFEAWTPLYGSASSPTDSVSNAWPYAWTSVDFTGFVAVGDDPGLTGIRLYAGPNSNDLAIHAVELCIDGQ